MDFNQLGADASQSESPDRALVKGRVLQADADFFAYETAHVDDPVSQCIESLKIHIEKKRKLTGAEFVNLHLTMGMKGGREQVAAVKGYQDQRSAARDPKLKARVAELRAFMATYKTNNITPVVNYLQEADDSLTQYNQKAIDEGNGKLSVIMSSDKDLWMSRGWHIDPKDGRMYEVTGYGHTEYREVGNVKPKLVGEGTSWFWHQMLMGDTVDNIPGLETISGRLLNEYLPTKKYNANRKAASCGPAKAVAILDGVTTDEEAAHRVYEAYFECYESDTAERILEQAFLLWMRRTGNVLDCQVFLKECGLHLQWSPQQITALGRFKQLALIQIEQNRKEQ